MSAVMSSSVEIPATPTFCLHVNPLVLQCVARESGMDPVENRNLIEVLHALLRVLTLLISVMISYCITW